MGDNLRCFYLMNGQIIFAELCDIDEDTGDFKIKHAVMVMIGQNKQLAMSTAYPFTNIDDEIELNRDHVTGNSSLDWNEQMLKEYDKFWEALRAKAAGIILPGDPRGGMPTPGPLKAV